MQIKIERDDCKFLYVDCDGTRNDDGHEGLDVIVGQGVKIHFVDEEDALLLASKIRQRLGKSA